MTTKRRKKTVVGKIDADILSFTVGKDPQTDLVLAEFDCVGSAAHVTMLSRMKSKPVTVKERQKIVQQLVQIIRKVRSGSFRITTADQDIHMAVERVLTQKLGDLGKKIHTARSRNDQIALDVRLYARKELLGTIEESARLSVVLLRFAERYQTVPMVGRTHGMPAMPSSVGLWASAYAESLLDDIGLLMAAYDLNDQSPLGAAAGYGVPLPIDRELTAKLLGFSRPCHNVLSAMNARGKCESAILSAMGQVMLTLSRLSADLILYTMPEFNYFKLPAAYCTGSSIMPQKQNPDVLELVRAKASRVLANSFSIAEIVRGLPGGYNRDLQETKAPFIEGIEQTRASVRILVKLIKGVTANKKALLAGFTAGVFSADDVLELVGSGLPFRDAYNLVKKNLDSGEPRDPQQAVAAKKHLGAPAGLDLDALSQRAIAADGFAKEERRICSRAISKLLGIKYAH